MAFIEWLAVPSKDRRPKTQQSLARKLGVVRETLSRWKRQAGFMDAVYGEARRHLDGRLPDILDKLAETAEKGNVSAIRLALEATGRLVDRHEVVVKAVEEYGADEYASAASWLEKWQVEQFGPDGADGATRPSGANGANGSNGANGIPAL